jgi:hypothetical protein
MSAITRKMSSGLGNLKHAPMGDRNRSIRDDSFAGGMANVVVINDAIAIDQISTGRDWGRNDHHGHEADVSNAQNR